MASCADVLRSIWTLRPLLFTIGIILGALPILFVIDEDVMPGRASRCLYCLVIMAFLWVTETLPVSVTALFPIVLFPLVEVLPAKQVSGSYVNDTTMLFFGGLMVAVAVEEWNLHKRIAILILKGVGSEPKGLMLGLMLPTWFMSMWISNTATTSMMIPIANAIIFQTIKIRRNQTPPYPDSTDPIPMTVTHAAVTDKENPKSNNRNQQSADMASDEAMTEIRDGSTKNQQQQAHDDDDDNNSREFKMSISGDRQSRKITIALTLCVAYSANIGGIATLTGTPPNLILRGVADDFYRSYQRAAGSNDTSGSGITFSSWMSMALPLSFLALLLAWVILVLVFMTGRGCCTSNPMQKAAIKKVVDKEWKALGKMTLAEVETLCIFVFLVVLWISRDPKESPGWGTWFKSGYVSDSVSSMLMALLLFILPAKVPDIVCRKHPVAKESSLGYTPLLTWKKAQEKLPWGVILLIGGGFALANACKDSGLSFWLGQQFAKLDYLDTWLFNMVVCSIVAAFTEVTSNTATATILMPILADLGVAIGLNPLYLMTSSAIATSFAFMLPVATAPNAIVFSYGHIRIIDMASVGLIMNIMAVGVVTLCVNTWGKHIFDFDHFDPIFKATLSVNNTELCP